MSDWGEIEPYLLEDVRGPVPSFPLDLLPPFWRDWVGTTARSAGAPADYVAQSVLAAVAGLAGGGAQVRITPRWVEPLVLWQAMVGPPASGNSAVTRALGDNRNSLRWLSGNCGNCANVQNPAKTGIGGQCDATCAKVRELRKSLAIRPRRQHGKQVVVASVVLSATSKEAP